MRGEIASRVAPHVGQDQFHTDSERSLRPRSNSTLTMHAAYHGCRTGWVDDSADRQTTYARLRGAALSAARQSGANASASLGNQAEFTSTSKRNGRRSAVC